jgi:hypothetical protein
MQNKNRTWRQLIKGSYKVYVSNELKSSELRFLITKVVAFDTLSQWEKKDEKNIVDMADIYTEEVQVPYYEDGIGDLKYKTSYIAIINVGLFWGAK